MRAEAHAETSRACFPREPVQQKIPKIWLIFFRRGCPISFTFQTGWLACNRRATDSKTMFVLLYQVGTNLVGVSNRLAYRPTRIFRFDMHRTAVFFFCCVGWPRFRALSRKHLVVCIPFKRLKLKPNHRTLNFRTNAKGRTDGAPQSKRS